MRLWIPLTILALAAAAIYAGYATEHTLRVVFVYLFITLAFIGILFWWIFLTGRTRWRSLLNAIAVAAVVFVAAGLTVRFDGAATGANVFGFRWVWEKGPKAPEIAPSTATATDNSVAPTRDDHPGIPGFLGENRDGRVPDPGLIRDWSTNPPEELWRIEVGLGWSAFAVAGDFAVTQEQRGDSELVTAYSLETGELLWAHADPVRFSEPMGGDGPRATPTLDGGIVYAAGATGILNALKLETGEKIWSRSILDDTGLPNIEWGVATSPLLVDNLVVVTGGDTESTPLLAYDRATGEPVWQAGRGPASYSSPVLLEVDGVRQIVAVFEKNVAGFDPASGESLWTYEWPGNFPKVAQPMPVDANRLLLTASYPGVNSALIKISKSGSGWSVTEIWNERTMKTKFSSAHIVGDHAYGLDEGRFACIEIATGDRLWKGGKYGYGQNLLIGDDLILVQGERGQVALLKATPDEHRELALIQPLNSKTWNAPALAGPYLLVRNDREAVCLKLPLAQ